MLKDEIKLLGWGISTTLKFVFLIVLIVGGVLFVAKICEVLKIGNINDILLWIGIPFAYFIAYLLDKHWWRNTATYHNLMNKQTKRYK